MGRGIRRDRGKEGGFGLTRKSWNIFPAKQFLSNILEFTLHLISSIIELRRTKERHIISNIQRTASACRHFRKSFPKSSQQCTVDYCSKTLGLGPDRQLAFLYVLNIPSLQR
jgi:hypothetical protein